jgi:ABC-type antimicrobial peptide transport system permease subunit
MPNDTPLKKLLFLLAFSLFLISFFSISSHAEGYAGIAERASYPISLHVRTVDAATGYPIQNATLILWDLSTFNKPQPGAGIYSTDENGECIILGDYLKVRHFYWLYAYKGNFEEKIIDYAPVKMEIYLERPENISITLRMVPGAMIEVEGIPYLVQSPSPEERYMIITVKERFEPLNYSFIREYGNSPDVYMLGLDRKTIIVPANTPLDLEVKVWFFLRETGRITVSSEIFYINNNSLPFIIPQRGLLSSIKIPAHSLRKGLLYIESVFADVSSKLDEAQRIGFTVFDERRILTRVSQRKIEAESLLQSAQTDKDFENIWLTLREALGEINYVYAVLQNKYLISKTNAVYLSAVISVFSIVLSSFFFENEKRKILSGVVFYIASIAILYFIHPGSHVIIDENLILFLQSASISFIAVLAIVFGIPRVWKERTVEGEVSWRSALSVIFSMGKRQIRRKKIRGFFTILSICILILAFTSLTSFGTAFGVVSSKLNATPPSEGILIKRMINGSSLVFSPLGYGDIISISRVASIFNVAQRLKNYPKNEPAARLVNPNTGSFHFIYGVLAVSPSNESIYTNLKGIVEGGYLSEEGDNEVLISVNVAEKLGIRVGGNITLEVSGTAVKETLNVKGLINDEGYEVLVDIDGSHLGPSRLLEDGSARRCNSTEIIVTNLKTAEKIQMDLDAIYGRNAPQFILPSEIIFQLNPEADLESTVKNLVFLFGYDVLVSRNNEVTYYYVGSYIEFKGVAELLIPMVMVILNVSMVMVNSAYERGKEIRVLSMLGLNPTHIGLTFVAEAIVMGMVGGSLGYLAGLGFYRIMILFGQDLMVREKLEWWWSALGFLLAILVSVLSAMRPAAMAVSAYTPSKIRKVKRSEEEKKKRKEEIFKVYHAREISMPVKVLPSEKEFFLSFFLDRLNDLRTGYTERVENIEDIPEIENVKGEVVKRVNFVYYFGPPERRRGTKNSLVLIKSPYEEYYRVKLVSEPASPGIPESAVDRTVDFIHDIMMLWAKDKKKIIGIP